MWPSTRTQVLGVDYSSRKVAVALLPSGGGPLRVFSYVCPKTTTDRWERFRLVTSTYRGWLKELKGTGLDSTLLSIESPLLGMSKNAQTLIDMAMVAGALVYITDQMLWVKEKFYVPPATWKKEVCGRGDLTKWETAEWMRLALPGAFSLCTSDDEVDAVCLALYAAGKEASDAKDQTA